MLPAGKALFDDFWERLPKSRAECGAATPRPCLWLVEMAGNTHPTQRLIRIQGTRNKYMSPEYSPLIRCSAKNLWIESLTERSTFIISLTTIESFYGA